ncbi:HK97 family phage prohead protease [Klebsiella pneumoniae]|uniref:HK97 family phage prohead protease n=1 Tax=Klebsiella pneumoniae TaxID=573 RepID=UPI001CBD6145|nr:HK97 family phage prohead protease [Klebsiella pneumoniae]EKX7637464.1 HK97 family phage prohead protease [Klebsiella pneumoniae]ELA1308037.1 HK97 family phage prohead protease [Klebsiella pneumoniae]MBZ1696860.1 HK97 family phage prohead protease [Klebsiella pneumoniae]HDZ2531256.1 HK97 family phage prohead protease [Klebsiella pneumoniae]HDZ2539728.1 HK97 family phage prohead protease [Klebsiella pneumoniae]
MKNNDGGGAAADREVRSFLGEVRTESQNEQPTKIIGYAAVFNSRSEPMYGFREIIAPGAFDDVLQDDVRGLFNHDPNYVLGRTTSNTLAISVDAHGLRYEITAPDTQTIKDLVVAPISRGDVNQSSFAFRVAPGGERWYEDDEGVVIREITKFSRLYDVSPVTYPAYRAADSSVRSLENWKQQRSGEELTHKTRIEKESRARELDMLSF